MTASFRPSGLLQDFHSSVGCGGLRIRSNRYRGKQHHSPGKQQRHRYSAGPGRVSNRSPGAGHRPHSPPIRAHRRSVGGCVTV